jgi:putative FmdB family regulatory protein
MPIYDYRCRKCANEFEHLVLKGLPDAACPECGGVDLEQLLSGFAVSSKESRQANATAQRRRNATSAETKEKQVADVELQRKEHDEHGHG